MAKEQGIILAVLLGTVIMLLFFVLVIVLVFNHRKKHLILQNQLQRIKSEKEIETIKAIINSQETERNRIARNLHDTIGAELSIIQFNLTRYIHEFQNSKVNIKPLSDEVLTLENTIESIRNICHELFPLTLKRYGLINRLKQSAERLNQSGILQCSFLCSLAETNLLLSIEDKINILRIYTEIINNIVKHACAKHLTIDVLLIAHQFIIEFGHNGIPFTNVDADNNIVLGMGIGLSSILNRTKIMYGTISYTLDNNISKITVTIPINIAE